jgi:hypothetical protein
MAVQATGVRKRCLTEFAPDMSVTAKVMTQSARGGGDCD